MSKSLKDLFKYPLGQSGVPDPATEKLDQDSERLIGDMTKRGLESADDIYKQDTGGIEQASQMVQPSDDQLQQESQKFGVSDQGVARAIRNKYANMAQADTQKLLRNQQMQSQIRKSERLVRASQVLTQRRQLQLDQYERQMQAYVAKQQARSAAIRSILGAGGMAAGFAMGGPAGGIAGAQLGSMAGGAVAGNSGTPMAGQSYLNTSAMA